MMVVTVVVAVAVGVVVVVVVTLLAFPRSAEFLSSLSVHLLQDWQLDFLNPRAYPRACQSTALVFSYSPLSVQSHCVASTLKAESCQKHL